MVKSELLPCCKFWVSLGLFLWNINQLKYKHTCVWGWYIFILLKIANSSNQDQVFLRVLWRSRGWNSAVSLLWPGFSLWSGNWGPILWAMWCSPAAAKSLQSCPTLCNPIDGSPPGSPSLGFSRQEHWSRLPFPSPMHESEKGKWSCSVVSDSWRPHRLQPTRPLRPWDFPGKSTGVGCHCLLRWCSPPPPPKRSRVLD